MRTSKGDVGRGKVNSLTLHDLFQQQTGQFIASADASEEEKQRMLLAMFCPCCGMGAMSYSIKLRPEPVAARISGSVADKSGET